MGDEGPIHDELKKWLTTVRQSDMFLSEQRNETMLNNVNDVAFHCMMAEYHYDRWNYYINLITRTILSDNEDDEIFMENRFLQNQAEYHDNKSSQFDDLLWK